MGDELRTEPELPSLIVSSSIFLAWFQEGTTGCIISRLIEQSSHEATHLNDEAVYRTGNR